MEDIVSKQLKSNEKRLQSLKIHKQNYQNQKLLIKSALSNIDKANNKIVFDKELTDQPAAQISNGKQVKAKKGQTLFEDNSDDDNFEADFSVKKQFEGEEGQKLLALQSKYKNDKRFNLSEKFLDDPLEGTSENGFNQNDDEELSLQQEKQREFEILDQVLQKYHIKPKVKEKPKSAKMMVRFDPSQPHHSKYEIKNDEIPNKKRKKDKSKNKVPEVLEEKKADETEMPEVSKNVFYQVKGNLKDSLHENNKVSLLSMFGQVHEKDIEEEKEEEKEVTFAKPNFTNEKNPFRYDSSDDEEEDVANKEETQPNNSLENKESTTSRTKLWVEPFFFTEDDYRLQEGFDFIEKMKMEDTSEFAKSRRELKQIVKSKVRNVQRKNKPFKRKLGGSKRRKDIRIKKALKK